MPPARDPDPTAGQPAGSTGRSGNDERKDATPERPSNRPSGLHFADVQRWFLERVIGPHRTTGSPIPGPKRDPSEVVLPSSRLTAEERIGVYSDLYRLRLREVIANDHPVLERIMGRERFKALARDYLSHYPPNDYTLRSVCHALPYYLQHHFAGDDKSLLLDVVRMERAVSDAFDTPEVTHITSDAIAEVPAAAWGEVRFRTDPSFRVLAFQHDVPAIVDAHHEQRELPDLGPRPAWAVVWRHHHRVWRQPVSRPVYTILSTLASGATVATALERGSEVWTGDEDELASLIFQWFANWMNEGYFHAVVLPPGASSQS